MNVAFTQWMEQVNTILNNSIGLESDDLTDAPWADYHSDEMSPREAILTANDDGWLGIPDELMEGV